MKRTPSQQAWFDARRQIGIWLKKRDFEILRAQAAELEQTISSLATEIVQSAIERFDREKR